MARTRKHLPLILIPLLIGTAGCGMSREEMETAVHTAARDGDVGLLRKILRKEKALASHADPDDMGRTPLHQAGSAEAAELLLEAGADASAEDRYKNTPLHTAHSGEVAELLLERGADMTAENATKKTPIQTVPDGAAARVLLAHGAELESERTAKAPLVLAVGEGRSGVVKVLLEAGADASVELGYKAHA